MKKILILLIIVGIILTGCKKEESKKYNIITTNFPGYDFARAITKKVEDIEVKMLIKPGSEVHSYEPTPQDIKNIKNCNLFIYNGGESDEWINDVIKDLDIQKTKIIKIMDLVNVVEEEHIEGMEEEQEDEEEIEYDEHVWTSPINTITILNKIKEEIIKLDQENKEKYEENTNKYSSEIYEIDQEIKNIVENSKRKEIIFGDRFPLRYFIEEYGLSYYAAFPGCSEKTEASAKTISFLIDKVKKDQIPVIFKIELSNGKIAKTIADETNAKVLEFHSAHNISQKDFDKGITYVDIMKQNTKNLKEALQ